MLVTRQSQLKLCGCVRGAAGLTADLQNITAEQQLEILRLDGRLVQSEIALANLQAALARYRRAAAQVHASKLHHSVHHRRGQVLP